MQAHEWKRLVSLSVSALSRTVQNGSVDISASLAKPKGILVDTRTLKMQLALNLDSALDIAWNAQRKSYRTGVSIRAFIELIEEHINRGILEPGHSRYRTWSTDDDAIRASQIEPRYREFCEWLVDHLPSQGRTSGAIETAAIAERELNLVIHPFADGCGRVSRVVAAWVLLRSDFLPPHFADIQAYYAHMRPSEDGWVSFYKHGVASRAALS